jgi:hypothetical protein
MKYSEKFCTAEISYVSASIVDGTSAQVNHISQNICVRAMREMTGSKIHRDIMEIR